MEEKGVAAWPQTSSATEEEGEEIEEGNEEIEEEGFWNPGERQAWERSQAATAVTATGGNTVALGGGEPYDKKEKQKNRSPTTRWVAGAARAGEDGAERRRRLRR